MLFDEFISKLIADSKRQIPLLTVVMSNNIDVTRNKLLAFLQQIQPDELGVDTLLFTTQQAINLDDIQPLRSFFAKTSIANTHKFVVLSNAACMNLHVSNSLLKIIEELVINQHLFFLTNARLVPTLHSRALTLFDKDEVSVIDYKLDYLRQDWAWESHEGLLKLLSIARYIITNVICKRFHRGYVLPSDLTFYFNQNIKYSKSHLFYKWQQINNLASEYLMLGLDRRHVQHMLLLQLV